MKKIQITLLSVFFLSASLFSIDIKVKYLGGTSYSERPDGKRIKLDYNTPIRPGDKIITEARSFVTLESSDGSVYKVFPNSEYKFEKLTVDETGKEQQWFKLNAGKLNNYISKTVSSTKDIKFVTPSVVVGVRGTQFEMSADANGSKVMLIEGAIALENPVTGDVKPLAPLEKSITSLTGETKVEAMTEEEILMVTKEAPVQISEDGETIFTDTIKPGYLEQFHKKLLDILDDIIEIF